MAVSVPLLSFVYYIFFNFLNQGYFIVFIFLNDVLIYRNALARGKGTPKTVLDALYRHFSNPSRAVKHCWLWPSLSNISAIDYSVVYSIDHMNNRMPF